MTSGAIDALRADRTALLEICGGLTEADWSAPSGCAGWRVQDVVAHMGSLYWLVVDRSVLPDTGDTPTEQAQERHVEARRSWSSKQVLDDYADVSEKALDALVALESLPMEIPLGDLGTYQASLLPNAYAFDHYTHIRADLFAPRGPLQDPPISDELRLEPTLDWIAAAAPQQNTDLLSQLGGSVEILVVGPSARTITIGSGEVKAHIECGAHDLVLWSTQRAEWEELGVTAKGEDGALALARRIHVF